MCSHNEKQRFQINIRLRWMLMEPMSMTTMKCIMSIAMRREISIRTSRKPMHIEIQIWKETTESSRECVAPKPCAPYWGTTQPWVLISKKAWVGVWSSHRPRWEPLHSGMIRNIVAWYGSGTRIVRNLSAAIKRD